MSTTPYPFSGPTEGADSPAPDPESGRHPVNTGHLVMGIAFLGLVAIWAVLEVDLFDGDALSWLLPVPWLVAGTVGLGVAALGSRRRRTPDRPTFDPYADPWATTADVPETALDTEDPR